MRITYLKHSGFAIETNDVVILVDYIGGGFARDTRPVLALVSHSHSDHYAPDMISFADVALRDMKEGEACERMGVRVTAYGSTDEGVSFLIEAGGKRIFHAGDLNLWHWRDDGDAEWTARAETDFARVMGTLEGQRLDAAMFPVDPRMGTGYDDGACIFNEALRPNVFIPMHFWDAPEAAEKFAKKYGNVRALTESGAYIEI